jgi:hypothetical protein
MIIGAIIIAIVVILAALLFIFLASDDNGKTESDGNGGSTTSPVGAFDFTETSTGNYTGGIVSLSDTLPLSDCSIAIIDTSTGASASGGPPLPEYTISTGSDGLTLRYYDTNSNNKVDAGDVWTLTNAYKNDQIKLIHETGKLVATYTIP